MLSAGTLTMLPGGTLTTGCRGAAAGEEIDNGSTFCRQLFWVPEKIAAGKVGRGSKPQWEFPRLCRGGRKSLTYPAVDTAGLSAKLRIVSRQTHEEECDRMDDDERLSHTKWSANSRNCRLQRLSCW
jgi:hypothetical protein